MQNKVYVAVEAFFSEEGALMPRALQWEDGRLYRIDRVLDVRPAPALKAGGQGDRYTIQVLGQRSFLFFERAGDAGNPSLGRWFVERKRA